MDKVPPHLRKPYGEIIAECAYCHLPIYKSDSHEQMVSPVTHDSGTYHSGCAWRVRVKVLSDRVKRDVHELREMGVTVTMELIIPTR